jgi:hypothetical protein
MAAATSDPLFLAILPIILKPETRVKNTVYKIQWRADAPSLTRAL